MNLLKFLLSKLCEEEVKRSENKGLQGGKIKGLQELKSIVCKEKN